jgi:peptidoglycan/xylan/chitin deacetylase (PgdA/CDA1 family)
MKEKLKQVLRSVGLKKSNLALLRTCCERNLLARVKPAKPRAVGRILCYHSIGQAAWGVNDVSPERFRRHIELALEHGYRFVPASRVVETGGTTEELAITFDDGLRSVMTAAAPILKDYGIPWTVFVVSDWCDQRSSFGADTFLKWRDVETIMAAGAEIGSHSVTHPNFGALSLGQMQDELGRSRQVIAERVGLAAPTFAIPFGQSGNWTATAAAEARAAGYTTVYAQAEETRPEGTIARTFVTKFDDARIFAALLGGAFDRWEEWVPG